MEKIGKTDKDVIQMLSEAGYSDKAIQFLQCQAEIGVLENANHVTDLTGPCGDSMKLSLVVQDGVIDDARIQVLGCPGAVASGCAVASLAKGRTLEQARNLTLDDVYREVEKLPDQKVHCARLALKTLHKAVDEYRNKQANQGCAA